MMLSLLKLDPWWQNAQLGVRQQSSDFRRSRIFHLFMLILIFSISFVCLFYFRYYLSPPILYQGSPEHPIEILFRESQRAFNESIARQSNSIETAVVEYRRRYGRDIPDGFSKWFEYAQKNQVSRIDDYDEMMQSFESFREAGSNALTRYIKEVNPGNTYDHLLKLSIRNHTVEKQGGWPLFESALDSLVASILDKLPDIDILFNNLDEPRVLLDKEHLDNGEQFYNRTRQNAWADIGYPCKERKLSRDGANAPFDPYITNITESKDLCQHPENADKHGMILGADTLRLTKLPIPIFSVAKLSTFSDILYPAPYYIDRLQHPRYNQSKDIPWNVKTNKLYWAGSTTGGYAGENWLNFHRHRFVSVVNDLTNTDLGSKFSQDSNLYNVKFTRIVQCSEAHCKELKDFFRVQGLESLDAVYEHRYLFDMDGNGMSGRFPSLLASRSLVLKQTLQREFFDEWLWPWVHYVPVSMDLGELPDMMRFLALTPKGQQISKDIAEGGKEWAQKNLREVDMISYMYRLLLEYNMLFK